MANFKLATLGILMSVILILAAAFVVGGAVIIVNDVEKLERTWQDYATGPVEKGIHLSEMETALGYGGMIHQFKNYVLRRTSDRFNKAQKAIQSFNQALAAYQKSGINPQEEAALKAISGVVEQYASNLLQVEQLVKDGRSTNEIDGIVKVNDNPALDGLDILRKEFIKARDLQTLKIEQSTSGIIGLATQNTILTAIILILTILTLLWFTHLRLLRPLNEMISSMKALAAGNSHIEIPALNRSDEIGEMAKALDVFKDNAQSLEEMTETIAQATHEVTNASQEISSGSMDLSQRTEHQAASIEETSASMAQVSSTVTQNARNAADARKLSMNAREMAEKGQSIVSSAVHAMGEIETSSQKISDIIGVIDEIAFQTNLLALNAAVEAARAGDAGKGFAVVATEVGKLARRSSDAAKDIKDLIATSEDHVADGVKLVDQAGESLSEIVKSVADVTDLISDIAVASKEQANSIQEINVAITNMDEMTQQNSALVEESAAATRALEDQAIFLKQSVAKLDEKGNSTRQLSSSAMSAQSAIRAMAEIRKNKPVRSPMRVGQQPKPATAPKGKDLDFDDDDWEEF